ncbi:MAG: hypothetical protein AB8B99_16045 [Phormidesmis sp.]
MSPTLLISAGLSPDSCQDIGIQVLSRSPPISHIATTHQVSRKFVYQQGDKAKQALDKSFSPSKGDDDILWVRRTIPKTGSISESGRLDGGLFCAASVAFNWPILNQAAFFYLR